MRAVISLKNVSSVSSGYKIINDISVDFPENAWSFILGTTGSGKSTLLKTAAGLAVADSGTVSAWDRDMAKFSLRDEQKFRSRSGFIFQDAALWANQSIINNVAMPLRIHKAWMSDSEVAEACRQILARLGYTDSLGVRPAELSSGEKKIVSIARALVHEPKLVFMDDPAGSLDDEAQDKLVQELKRLKETKISAIIVSNNSELVYQFADYLLIIKDGQKLDFGPYEEIMGKAETDFAGTLARLKARGKR